MTKILLRRNTATYFATNNPLLAKGEPAFATDTNTLKIGDGVNRWNNLSSIASSGTGGGGGPELNDLTSIVTWATVPDAYISESSVVQHSGALRITESQIVDLQNYLLNVVEDVTPQLGGTLDLNSNNIIGSGNITIDGNVDGIDGIFDRIVLSTGADPTIEAGMIGWSESEGTINAGVDGNVKIHLGEHNLFRIRNSTAGTLYAGQAVYATGIHNNTILTADKYIANDTINEIRFLGLVLEDIDVNQKGYAINFGHIENLDTRGNGAVNGAGNLWNASEPEWFEGDILYVNPTDAGKLTKTKPQHAISAAIVMYVNQNTGKILVRPRNFGHLTDDHDVSISSPQDGQVLSYNSGTEIWENNNLFNTDLVAGTGITLAYNSGNNQLAVHSNLYSDPAGIAGASGINNIVKISQSAYSGLGTYDPNTLYFIV